MQPPREPAVSPAPKRLLDARPEDWSLPLLLRSPISAREQPVTRGVPFPHGILTDPAAVALFDSAGREVFVQTQALSRWSDGSVRWLLLDFLIEQIATGERCWTLRSRSGTTGVSPPPLTVLDTPEDAVLDSREDIVVHSGITEFRLNPFHFSLRARGARGEPSSREVDSAIGPFVTGATALLIDTIALEEGGPVRATVCLLGDLFVARLSFFGGTGLVRIRLTARNEWRASHKGGLWDQGAQGAFRFKELGLAVGLVQGEQVHWTSEPSQPVRLLPAGSFAIYQDSSGGENWQSRIHVNRKNRVPCSFRGYRVRHGKEERVGLRASPIVSLVGEKVAVTAAIAEFWQQFPKAITVEKSESLFCRLSLFPAQFEDRFELQGGEQKTHTVWLHFGPPSSLGDLPLAWVHQPVSLIIPPEWYAASGAVPHLPVETVRGAGEERLDALVSEAISGPNSFFAKREVTDEYGWRHFGEVYADHENAHYDGPKPIVSHYNNQYDVIYGSLLQFFRTGDIRWWDIADPLARHVTDIDIYHTTRDRAAYNGGLFWHTDHYRDAATSTHRAYSKANAPPGKPYGGGPSCEHNYTTGLLHYYYLTGDPLARDAVLELAGWVLRMDDGTRNILGIVDDGPTGLASATRDSSYHGPGRGAGNSVNALLDAWLLTGQRHYLDYAETLIRRCVHPADDIDAHNLLDIENRWSYTVFLSVLCRYLDLKAESEELDYHYGYARASLLHYAAWMEQHERPYFEQLEKLEYPTETWAAQEMRKANVLRLAARHAEEPLRGRLLKRGLEFAERAWADLLRFESRMTTRPLAIMMREGTVDLYLRQHELPPAPAPREQYEFGKPERFVPQRERVKARLKSLPGLVSIALRLINPRNWLRYLARRRQ